MQDEIQLYSAIKLVTLFDTAGMLEFTLAKAYYTHLHPRLIALIPFLMILARVTIRRLVSASGI